MLIVADYVLNKEYIAKNICENRNKPKLHCNGKCHLKKQLAEDESGKKGSSQSQQERQEVNLFFQYSDIHIPLLVVPVIKPKFITRNNFLLLDFIRNIFHPPSFRFSL
ncbi:hypothetical protein [Polluticoccus soli]|uniref:hypothetical protein n=1 Tax=Polluticoccus soli TaxID=3034150 RepID=UPI0023E28D59|nr:hypothetical protein [Flavipsychrobacter sp. JY13-12]